MAENLGRRAITPVALILFLLGFGLSSARAEPGNERRAPNLGDCEELQVPVGHKVAFHAYAIGVQNWGWNGSSWDFLRPDAVLHAGADDDGVIGTHYAGPTWESNSGSYVVAAVLDRCTPDPSAIPWLLLVAVESDGPGIFDGVTFIQRVNTVGGLAPAEPGNLPGDVAAVPYTADYYFYRKHK